MRLLPYPATPGEIAFLGAVPVTFGHDGLVDSSVTGVHSLADDESEEIADWAEVLVREAALERGRLVSI